LNQALCEKRSEYQKRQHKVILFHDNAPSQQNWSRKRLKHLVGKYFRMRLTPDLTPSDYHLFASMGHALAQQRFTSYEDVRKWLDDWFGSKEQQFFWRGIHKLSNRWKKCIAIARWTILRIKYFLSFSCNKCVFSIKKFRFIYIPGIEVDVEKFFSK